MKRIVTLFLATGLFFGATAPVVHSSEFKTDGFIIIQSQISKDLRSFAKDQPEDSEDPDMTKFKRFLVNERIAIGFNWIHNDDLTARLFFYAPQNVTWGTDYAIYSNLYIQDAYFKFVLPTTEDVHITAGQFKTTLPLYMGTSNPVLDEYYTGIKVTTPLSDTMGLDISWLRMSGRSASTGAVITSNMADADYFDMFNLVLPVKMDSLEITPWASMGLVGKNNTMGSSAYNGDFSNIGSFAITTTTTTGLTDSDNDIKYQKEVSSLAFTKADTSNIGTVEGTATSNRIAYMLGLNTKFKTESGLVVGADFLYTGSDMPNKTIYGYDSTSTTTGYTFYTNEYGEYWGTGAKIVDQDGNDVTSSTEADYNAAVAANKAYLDSITHTSNTKYHLKYKDGFLADVYFSYPFSSLTIGGGLWYATGDNIDTKNKKYTYGGIISNNDGWGPGNSAYFDKSIHDLLYTSGVTTPAGTMGLSVNISNFQIFDNLKFGADLMYVMGTNKYTDGDVKSLGQYNWLTTEDSLVEVGMNFKYLMYPEIETAFEFNYILPMFGDYIGYEDNGKTNKSEEIYRIGLSIKYFF